MADQPRAQTVRLQNGRRALALDVASDTSPAAILELLSLPAHPRAVIAVSGGASHFSAHLFEHTHRTVQELLALAFQHHVMLVDGGTAAGIMQIVGLSYAQLQRESGLPSPPLLGFAPAPLVATNIATVDDRPGLTPLDEHHPYFVLVRDAHDWGREITCMFGFVDHLSDAVPSVAVIANGGLLTLAEVERNVASGRKLVLLEGTMRLADVLIAASRGVTTAKLADALTEAGLVRRDDGADSMDQMLSRVTRVVEGGHLVPVAIDAAPGVLGQTLASLLDL